ncbi:MAG: poly-beta-1,6-N-acetyl-D-glucosamine N-deacetylase PgaB [Gammaproteobacteria bacterium]|nr:poly-beta-1,6-N-acetyl-D-glucosamine N-deacetylase PgaB [Gammaproteobacteria bacterium]
MRRLIIRLTRIFNMRVISSIGLIALTHWAYAAPDITIQIPKNQFAVLAFHDIREDVIPDADRDPYAMSTARLAHFFDWIHEHHLHPVSLQQIIDAGNNRYQLPDNAVLLTFDDGPESNFSTLFPLLKSYRYPALLALETGWITGDVPNNAFGKEGFVTWSQLREMRDSGLVEFATHTHDLHKGILANPQGNLEPAALTRLYDSKTNSYESDAHYADRIKHDLALSSGLIEKNLKVKPRAVVWPYGAMNDQTREIANSVGLPFSFSLDDDRINDVQNMSLPISRLLVFNNPTAVQLEQQMSNVIIRKTSPQRSVLVRLDDVYDPDPVKQETNLSKLLDRIKALNIRSVYLRAFYDPHGDGVASQVYFPNRYLPMRADLFNRVAWQLRTRVGVDVYAELPILNFALPNSLEQQRLAIQGVPDRLNPSLPESVQIIGGIYEDLGKNTRSLSGVLINDHDALTDAENLSRCVAGGKVLEGGESCQHGITQEKVKLFTSVIDTVTARLRHYQNSSNRLKVVRSFSVPSKLDAIDSESFAQTLTLLTQHYNEVMLVVKPDTVSNQNAEKFLKTLARQVVQQPWQEQITVDFQAQDERHSWVDGAVLKGWMQTLQQLGVRNLAYFPDDFLHDQPAFSAVFGGISLNQFPAFYKEPTAKVTMDRKVVSP